MKKTFNPNDKYPTAFIDRKDMEYSYSDGDLYYFMDTETWEQIPINKSVLGDNFKFVKENMVCKVLSYKGNVFGIELRTLLNLRLQRQIPALRVTQQPTLQSLQLLKQVLKLKFLSLLMRRSYSDRHKNRRIYGQSIISAGESVMNLTEKISYIRGLCDGLELDESKPEVKVLNAIVDLLDDMAFEVSDMEELYDELSAQVDEIDQDLADVESDVYDDEDYDIEDYDDEDDDYDFDDEENPFL